MAKDLTDILTRATEVRDESVAEQNTAQKVGGVLADLIDFVGKALLAAELSIQASPTGLYLIVTYHDENGTPYQKQVPIPLVSETQAGILTASQLQFLKNFAVQEGTPEQSKLPIKYTSPLSGTVQTFLLGSATADRAGVMTTGMFADLQTATNRRIELIDISQLDTLTSVPLQANGAVDYWLTHNNLIVGRMFMFEDMMFHKSTQIVFSNNYANGFPTGGHSKEGLTIYYRFYGHGSTDVTKGQWTAWKRLFDSDVSDPIATTSAAGWMSASDKTKLNNLSDKLVIDLGTVATSAVAEDYAAQSNVAGNRDILAIRYRTQVADEGSSRESFILQWVTGTNKCAQLLFHNLCIYRRDVTGATGESGGNTNAFDWEPAFVHKIDYATGTRKLTLKDYENNKVAEVQLPTASTSVHGMVKLGTASGTAYDGASGKSLAERITALETRMSTAENKIGAFHPL